ncbi:MAG: dTDP-4-dehydrorhamnose 3,5-epimerase family protein [Deltaproteobacteria bacterium]|nr:dTDP-4-dehydrorhamnose 3,5-epimerase family protein [Deltaproteobacteria bacterium]
MKKIENTGFDGIYKINHKKFIDERGYFSELFRTEELIPFGFEGVAQQNISLSGKGVIRGLHLQTEPYEQSKIITVLSGSIFDIVLDLRRNSSTYLKIFSVKIDMDSYFSLLIPKGFAHGFQALEDDTVVLYSVDNIYSAENERGINIFSNGLDIRFPVEEKIISQKDENLPELHLFLREYEKK